MEEHLTEEQLVLHYYGESLEGNAHLDDCAECRAQLQAIQRVLNTLDAAPVPERPAEYGAQVWQRLAPKLGVRQRRRWFAAPQWAMGAAAAALLIGAFVLGRVTSTAPPAPVAQQQVRERVLLVAVGNHLERSQMMLVELANSQPGQGKLDITWEQSTAEDLLESNRIYRQTALSSGDTATASVLDDLERVLMEIAHSPANPSEQQYEDLRKNIEDRGILFKVKVFGSKVRARQGAPAPEAGTL